jgi:hypothetical protein
VIGNAADTEDDCDVAVVVISVELLVFWVVVIVNVRGVLDGTAAAAAAVLLVVVVPLPRQACA